MTKEAYFEMCRVMDQEPDPAQIPVDFSDFPVYVQELWNIVHMLPDIWDGMSGAYMGKNFSILPYLLDVYKVEDHALALRIINSMVAKTATVYNNKLKQKQEAEAKKRKK